MFTLGPTIALLVSWICLHLTLVSGVRYGRTLSPFCCVPTARRARNPAGIFRSRCAR